LKAAIHELESKKIEVIEELYHSYLELCSYDPGEAFAYKSYVMEKADGGEEWVHVKESKSIASDGSTGVHCWPSAVALSNYWLQNKSRLEGKSCLELGCGVGLTGMVIVKMCKTKTYIFSDYHPSVFKKIRDNLLLNGLVYHSDTTDEEPTAAASDNNLSIVPFGDVRVMRLDWRYDSVMPTDLDFVIGSDLTFLPDLIQPLVETIVRLLDANHNCQVYIAVPPRNPDSVALFESHLNSHSNLKSEIIPFDAYTPLLWAAKSETVQLYRIVRV
jgi:predicted nicotinamide N-methyase